MLDMVADCLMQKKISSCREYMQRYECDFNMYIRKLNISCRTTSSLRCNALEMSICNICSGRYATVCDNYILHFHPKLNVVLRNCIETEPGHNPPCRHAI